MGSVVSAYQLALADDWPATPQFATGPFDKVDVTAFNGAALFQVRGQDGAWYPPTGISVRAGVFKSVPGFSDVFPPGPTAARFRRAAAGVASIIDVDIYAPA